MVRAGLIGLAVACLVPASAFAEDNCGDVLAQQTLLIKKDYTAGMAYSYHEDNITEEKIEKREGLKALYKEFRLNYKSSTDRKFMKSLSLKIDFSKLEQDRSVYYSKGVNSEQVNAWIKCMLSASSDWKITNVKFIADEYLRGTVQYTGPVQEGDTIVIPIGFKEEYTFPPKLAPGGNYAFLFRIKDDWYKELLIDIQYGINSTTIPLENPKARYSLKLCRTEIKLSQHIDDLVPGNPPREYCLEAPGPRDFFFKTDSRNQVIEMNKGTCFDSDCVYITHPAPNRICGSFRSVSDQAWDDDFMKSHYYRWIVMDAENPSTQNCPSGFVEN